MQTFWIASLEISDLQIFRPRIRQDGLELRHMSQAAPESAADLFIEANLAALLPVIRVVKAKGATSHDIEQEVLGVFDDRLIAFRKRKNVALPPEVYEPGKESLIKSVARTGPLTELRWDETARVLVSGPMFYGSAWL